MEVALFNHCFYTKHESIQSCVKKHPHGIKSSQLYNLWPRKIKVAVKGFRQLSLKRLKCLLILSKNAMQDACIVKLLVRSVTRTDKCMQDSMTSF